MQTLQIGKDLHTNGYDKGKVIRVLHAARVSHKIDHKDIKGRK